MKHLILMRHAKSDWSVGAGDKDRPLNPRGREASPRMANWLSQKQLVPDHVLCSSAARTRETWDLMGSAKAELTATTYSDALYLAGADSIWKTVCGFWKSKPSIDRLLVLGHNPGMEELVRQLAECQFEMPTAAIAIFCFSELPQIDKENQILWMKHQIPKELPD